ncbi:hypothetical protein BY996DRAFT_8560820, partial [Phakopsora pachyrhizi]|uniref:HECT-type E3 ubiquitin transferase n=1 Tax=Phakopsora pachyrhizi TaxID=170000 RepID=A0AAV0BPR7_PHAPC
MYSFNGSSRSRPMINLGGQSVSSSSSPNEAMDRAKQQRQYREISRRNQMSVLKIQAFWRSRTVAHRAKNDLRKKFDHLLNSQHQPVISPIHHLNLSRLISFFFNPFNQSDHLRLLQWSDLMILHDSIPLRSYDQLSSSSSLKEIQTSWYLVIAPLMIRRILNLVSIHPTSQHSSTFLRAAQAIINHIIQKDYDGRATALKRLAKDWYWSYIRTFIVSFPLDEKSESISLAVQLSVRLLFKSTSNSIDPFLELDQAEMIDSFTTRIFSIPALPNRVQLSTLVQFSNRLPFPEICERIPDLIDRLDQTSVLHLFSNLLCWGPKFLSSSTISSKELLAYLTAIKLCVDNCPTKLFDQLDIFLESKTKTSRPSKSSSNSKDELSPKTLRWLSNLINPDHLSSLYSVSNRYSQSSRPMFYKLMVSIIFAWPSSREKVLNTLLYNQTRSGDGKINPADSNSNSQGGSLMRELWRSSVRSGTVGVQLRDRRAGGSPQGVLIALKNIKVASDWEALILLSELYSRCLMTLGDDEFFNDETKLTAQTILQNSSQVLSTGRNPLMLDELIGLAGLLRNLAFGLYWTEGQADIKKGHVAGTRVGLEQLRILATRLLQQIYIRDSRRPFCGSGFWSMTSTFDLRSFIQTVVYEESRLEEHEDHQGSSLTNSPPEDFFDPDVHILERLPQTSMSNNSRSRVSQRQLAFISPRLGVLNNIPFVIPFEQRVAIFRTFIESDRHQSRLDFNPLIGGSRYRATIRRDRVSEDGFLSLSSLGPRLKESIEIKFIDRYGLEEAGIDGGGVFKEFLTSLTKEVFDPNRGLWLVNKNQELYPNPHSFSREALSLEWYKFLGQVLGKALYEGILVDVDFADFFLNKWLGKQSYLDDLASLDPELYQGLLFLKNYKGDVEADLSLNFTITINEFDKSETIELIKNGSTRSVTSKNRIEYIDLVSKYKLNVQLERQSEAFFKGLNDIIESKWIRMFNQVELKVLVGGLEGHDIDVEDLERWTVYGGWDESHPTIRMFWKVVRGFDNDSKRKLLKFVTSSSRAPLLGFKELRPSFGIRCAGKDLSRLPSSSTCLNLLKLSEYEDEKVLREKLVYSINSNAGFDLS